MEVGHCQCRIVLTDEQHAILFIDFLFGFAGSGGRRTFQRRAPLRKRRPSASSSASSSAASAGETFLAAAAAVVAAIFQLAATPQRLVLARFRRRRGGAAVVLQRLECVDGQCCPLVAFFISCNSRQMLGSSGKVQCPHGPQSDMAARKMTWRAAVWHPAGHHQLSSICNQAKKGHQNRALKRGWAACGPRGPQKNDQEGRSLARGPIWDEIDEEFD